MCVAPMCARAARSKRWRCRSFLRVISGLWCSSALAFHVVMVSLGRRAGSVAMVESERRLVSGSGGGCRSLLVGVVGRSARLVVALASVARRSAGGRRRRAACVVVSRLSFCVTCGAYVVWLVVVWAPPASLPCCLHRWSGLPAGVSRRRSVLPPGQGRRGRNLIVTLHLLRLLYRRGEGPTGVAPASSGLVSMPRVSPSGEVGATKEYAGEPSKKPTTSFGAEGTSQEKWTTHQQERLATAARAA